jgi:periplasmic copper chaperone A
LMLMDLKQPLQAGQKFKGTLQFEKAGKVDVEFDVQSIGAQKPMHAH